MRETTETASVVWLERGIEGWWSCFYAPSLQDRPILLAEESSINEATAVGLTKLATIISDGP